MPTAPDCHVDKISFDTGGQQTAPASQIQASLDALLAGRMIRERKHFPIQQPGQKSAFKYSIKGYVLYCIAYC